MREWQNQSHVRWYCRYHIGIVPKYGQKAIFGTIRKDIGKILRELCDQMGIELVEGHAMPDHVHLCLSIPPKYSVANAVGRLKGKAAIRIHRAYLGRTRNFTGRIGKSNGIFAPVSVGAHRRSPHRPDAVSPRCPAALAYARVGSLAWSGSTSHGGCSAYSFPCLFACLIFTEVWSFLLYICAVWSSIFPVISIPSMLSVVYLHTA